MVKAQISHRRAFLKSSVVGFGFLSGLWVHLGFDPQTFVFELLQKILLKFEPQYADTIKAVFLALPIIITCTAVLLAFRRGGWFGLAAVSLAFLAGLWLDGRSIPLILLAIVIGFFSAKKPQY